MLTPDLSLKLKELINELESKKIELSKVDYIHNKITFFNLMKDLRKYLVSIADDKLYKMFFHSKYFIKYKEFFTDVNMYYLRSLESVQSISIMTKGIHNFSSFADLIDKELIKESFEMKSKELKYIDFKDAETLVIVGCGAMPETILYIYENTDIKNIVGVDYNHEAVFMAGEMISGLQLEKIKLHQGNGINYNFRDADIIYIPIFTSKKGKILKKIIETGKDNVQILAVTPKGFGNIYYESLGEIHPRLHIIHREDISTSYIAQEILVLQKYNF